MQASVPITLKDSYQRLLTKAPKARDPYKPKKPIDAYRPEKPLKAIASTIAGRLSTYSATPNDRREHFQVYRKEASSSWVVSISIPIGKKFFTLGSLELFHFDDTTQEPTITYSNALIEQMILQRSVFEKINLSSLNSQNSPNLAKLHFIQSYLKTKKATTEAKVFNVTSFAEDQKIDELIDPTGGIVNKTFLTGNFAHLTNKANTWLHHPVTYGLVYILGMVTFVAIPLILAETVAPLLGELTAPVFMYILIVEVLLSALLSAFCFGNIVSQTKVIDRATQAVEQLNNLVNTYNQLTEEDRTSFVEKPQDVKANEAFHASPLVSYRMIHSYKKSICNEVSEEIPSNSLFELKAGRS